MLQTQTVEPGTFSLLKELMVLPALQDFALVGVTALSLYYGHRISVDLDIFTHLNFSNEEVIKELGLKFGDNLLVEQKPPNFGVFCYINNVKVDIVRFPSALIRPIKQIDGIRFYSPEEIVAMKVQAILNRAQKKDFYDVAELLNHFTVEDFIDLHKEKYPNQNIFISVPQAMSYFDDAEDSDDPISLKKQTWQSVKKKIQSKVSDYLK